MALSQRVTQSVNPPIHQAASRRSSGCQALNKLSLTSLIQRPISQSVSQPHLRRTCPSCKCFVNTTYRNRWQYFSLNISINLQLGASSQTAAVNNSWGQRIFRATANCQAAWTDCPSSGRRANSQSAIANSQLQFVAVSVACSWLHRSQIKLSIQRRIDTCDRRQR